MNPLKEALMKKKGMGSMSDSEMGEDMMEEEDDIDMSDEETMAAKAVMRALKRGDTAEFAKSLKGFVKMCGSY